MSAGISQVAKHHINTATPATRPRVASTMGAADISTMRAAASTVMATAPIEIQYGGLKSRGSNGKDIIRRDTSIATAMYNTVPKDQAKTAVIASTWLASSKMGSRVAASTATVWAPTVHTNNEPMEKPKRAGQGE